MEQSSRITAKTTTISHLNSSFSPPHPGVLVCLDSSPPPLFWAGAGQGMSRRRHALRGPAEPHLWLPGHRGAREQRQVPAPLLHPGHAAGQPGVVHGQPAGNGWVERGGAGGSGVSVSLARSIWTLSEARLARVISCYQAARGSVGRLRGDGVRYEQVWTSPPSPYVRSLYAA